MRGSMIKFVFPVVLTALLASLSLAQDADTSNAQAETIEVQKAAPTEIARKECPDKKWVLGFEVNSLDLKNLPGKMFSQMLISKKLHMGASFGYNYYNNNPGEYYNAEDSVRSNSTSKSWTLTFAPEIGYTTDLSKYFMGGAKLRLNLSITKESSNSFYRSERYYYYYDYRNRNSSYYDFSLTIPVYIEKRFNIKKYPVALGVIGDFMYLSSGWQKESSKYTRESYYYETPIFEEDERTAKDPVTLQIYNPLANYVRAYFKFFL
jgi:hypothetical protein